MISYKTVYNIPMKLHNKNILITGAAVRVGRQIAVDLARSDANILLHYGSSEKQARQAKAEIEALGASCHLLQANLNDPAQTKNLVPQALEHGPLYALINNAAIFENITLFDTSPEDWDKHLNVNLTAPFLLSQAFAKAVPEGNPGRIVNILDWRALRPGTDHFPYTISKAGLTALTKSLAVALAPNITVNGIAFGAILPPADSGDTTKILEQVPAQRWAELEEVSKTVEFLLDGPSYITGEIIHLDGGRHLV